MAFYYKPPKGVLSFSKLDHGAKIRLQFLLDIHNCNGNMVLLKDLVEQACTVEDSEWLIEGGKKDQVSHYFCRLACSQTPEMIQFYVRTERTLFRYRVSCMREEELQHTVKYIEKLHKILKQQQTQSDETLCNVFETINALTNTHSLDIIVREYFKGSHMVLPLPFLSVINLVKRREVPLRRGFAYVPVTSLLEILVPLFESTLRYGMKLAVQKFATVKEDIRIRRLCLQLKAMFLGKCPSLTSICPKYHLKCDDIDQASSAFPLCMSLLHMTLRKKHRLSHSARVQYTLFLKECGLPVNEAILFWQREYSQPTQHGSCTHRWEKDGKRYIYSIRHLYGLEGARKNYRGHSCTSIQDFHISSSQEGGCPFKHMDAENLQQQLSKENLSTTCRSQILEAAKMGNCRHACSLFLRVKSCQDGANVRDIEEAMEPVKCERLAGNNIKPEFSKLEVTPISRTEMLDSNMIKSEPKEVDRTLNRKFKELKTAEVNFECEKLGTKTTKNECIISDDNALDTIWEKNEFEVSDSECYELAVRSEGRKLNTATMDNGNMECSDNFIPCNNCAKRLCVNVEQKDVTEQEETMRRLCLKVSQEGVSVKQEGVRVKQEGMSVEQEGLNIKQESMSIKQGVMNVKQESKSVKQKGMGVKQDVVSVERECVSVKQEDTVEVDSKDTLALMKGRKRAGTFSENIVKRTKVSQSEEYHMVDIRAPVDYYESYCKLLDGLS